MAKDGNPRDLMNYADLQQDALRGVIRAALKRAASPAGIPGDHQFYISFQTGAEGVMIPPDLESRYPEEMTIVLQHQYWDLTPGEDEFSVTLQFGGQPKSLSIPYSAITRFHDPSVQYLLQFAPAPVARPAPMAAPTVKAQAPDGPDGDAGPKIISLDQFRKK